MNNILESALENSKRGWAMLPVYGIRADGACACGNLNCSSPGKHPKSKNGSKDATVDELKIRQFCQSGTTNIGIATGRTSCLCILDVDPKNGGDRSFLEIINKFGPLPKTIVALTGSEGGRHYYFKYPICGMRNKTNILPGLDIRGDGGFVVAPPSLHKSGRNYMWEYSSSPDNTAISEMPDWLLDLILNKESKKQIEGGLWSVGGRNNNLFKLASSLQGRGMETLAIHELITNENENRCQPPLDASEVKKIVESVERYPRGSSINNYNWKPIIKLPPLEVEVPSLPENLIPEPLRAWVLDVVNRMQSSSEMVMAPVLVVLSGMIGRRLAIKPKSKDDWKIIPNLWGGIIAPPSAMKTPAMNEALKQIRRFEAESKKKYDEEMSARANLLKEDKNSEVPLPIRKRWMTNDPTTEKLGELLNQNPSGLIVFRDELYGFLMGMEKSGRENDRQFYLESFNGDGSYTYDRIGRGTVDISALCISILGGIQPDRLASYFSETVKNGSGDDGFLSRFQVMVYPCKRSDWKLVDKYPDIDAKNRAFKVFSNIAETSFCFTDFPIDLTEEMPIARFNHEAQKLFYDWLTNLERRLRSGEIESSAFEAHLTKYKKLMPSIALIFRVIKCCDPNNNESDVLSVDLESTKMAIAWCEFLEAHAKKIYADALRPQVVVAHALMKRVRSGDIASGMTVRSLGRKKWSKLTDSKAIELGLGLLESHNYILIASESPSGKGAPSEVIYLHPDLIRGR